MTLEEACAIADDADNVNLLPSRDDLVEALHTLRQALVDIQSERDAALRRIEALEKVAAAARIASATGYNLPSSLFESLAALDKEPT